MRRRPFDPSLDEKAIARQLVALSGAPYLHCLYTTRTLMRLSGRLDMGVLDELFDGTVDERTVGLPVDPIDIIELHDFLRAGVVEAQTVTVTPGAANEIRLLVSFHWHGTDFVYEHTLGGRLWPAGPWHFAAVSLRDQLSTQLGVDRPTIIVRAHRTEPPLIVPPQHPEPEATILLSRSAGREGREHGQTWRLPTRSPGSGNEATVPRQLADCVTSVLESVAFDPGTSELPVYTAELRGTRWHAIDLPSGASVWLPDHNC